MTASAHRGPAPWSIAGWNRRAAHVLWDRRIGSDAAEALAAIRLPAYRALAAFLVLLVGAAVFLVAASTAPAALPLATGLPVVGLVLVALGVQPLRRAGAVVRDALADADASVRRPAPLHDGRRFDAWAHRNGLEERLRSTDLAALLRAAR